MIKNSSLVKKGTVKSGRFLISYRIYENDAPHIVCVNGIQQSMGMWHTFVSRFSRNYRIILFDFPGHGKAKIISGPDQLSLEERVEILKNVMDKAGVSRDATLCAASWGGVVAASFAAKYPERIKTLILASLSLRANQKMIETIKEGGSIDINEREKMAQVLLKSFGDNLPQRFKERIANQFRTMTEEEIRSFYEHGLSVISSKKLSDEVDLKKIKARTILLNGENDTIIDLNDVKSLAAKIPDCEMRIVKGVGHFLHMESDGVLDIYGDILASKISSKLK